MAGLKARLNDQIGLDAETGAEAVRLVEGFIKEHVPGSLHGMVAGARGAGDDDENPSDTVPGSSS